MVFIYSKYLLRYLTTKRVVRVDIRWRIPRWCICVFSTRETLSRTLYSLILYYIHNTGMFLIERAACRVVEISKRRPLAGGRKKRKTLRDARSLEKTPRVPLRILKSEKYFEISRIPYLGLNPTDSFRPHVSSPRRSPCPIPPSLYIYSFRISPSTRGWYIRLYLQNGWRSSSLRDRSWTCRTNRLVATRVDENVRSV